MTEIKFQAYMKMKNSLRRCILPHFPTQIGVNKERARDRENERGNSFDIFSGVDFIYFYISMSFL